MNYEMIFKDNTYNKIVPKTLSFLKTWLQPYKDKLIIDIGCGRGNYLKELVFNNGFKIIGLEPCVLEEHSNIIVNHTTIQEYDSVSFPIGYCVDVLEHIPYDEIDTVLNKLPVIANKILVGIANHSDVWNGEELHPIQQNGTWWKQKLEQYFWYANLILEEPRYCFLEI